MQKKQSNLLGNYFQNQKPKKIVNCVACGKPISRLAKTCHHCSEPEPGKKTKSEWVTEGPFIERFASFLMWLILFIIAASIFFSLNPNWPN